MIINAIMVNVQAPHSAVITTSTVWTVQMKRAALAQLLSYHVRLVAVFHLINCAMDSMTAQMEKMKKSVVSSLYIYHYTFKKVLSC